MLYLCPAQNAVKALNTQHNIFGTVVTRTYPASSYGGKTEPGRHEVLSITKVMTCD
jgi:hypothetical protein